MNKRHPLKIVIERHSLNAVAKRCGVSHQAVRKWQVVGRLPRTEWTGETSYASAIASMSDGAVTKDELLAPWPDDQDEAIQSNAACASEASKEAANDATQAQRA